MRRAALLLALLTACAGAHASAKEVPSWVAELSSRSLPAYSARVPAVVLLMEQHVVVDPSGVITTTTRKGIKILNREGQRAAVAEEYYYAGGRKLKALNAWLVAPTGFSKTYDKSSVVDAGAFSGMELYNDIRLREIISQNPEVGSVFAYESVVEERSLFAQDEYAFQDELPAIESKYWLTVPSGWTARAVIFNHPPVQPAIDGSSYIWELKDLPYREQEHLGPSLRGLAPRLAVDFEPPPGASPSAGRVFHAWEDVARWHSELSAAQATATDSMIAKARELTANSRTEYEKAQAIGHYVQNIRYVAIEMDRVHGGGYKPHSAESVFRNQYGDCKDKANLMRALLAAVGVRSSLVAIYSGDRTYVREQWPSPAQFNHMILAIPVGDDTRANAIASSPVLGRLLFFDPTNDATPVGDLPWYEQGSFALICASEKGGILKMPVIETELNSITVEARGTLSDMGQLSATVESVYHGQAAAGARATKLHTTPDQYRRELERRLSRDAKDVALGKFDSEDAFAANIFRQHLEFESSSYAQLIQDRMLVFSLSVVEPAALVFPRVQDRTAPILLRSQLYRKHVRLKLPAGYSIDEMPQSDASESGFGKYSVSFKKDAGDLVMEEVLATDAATLAPDQYAAVKKFFDGFWGAESQRAVLVKN